MTTLDTARAAVRDALAEGVPREVLLAELAAMDTGRTIPTVAQFAPTVRTLIGPRSWGAYGTYLDRFVAAFPDRRLDDFAASELAVFVEQMRASAQTRAGGTGGTGALSNAISAVRKFFAAAVADRHLVENPARTLTMPARQPSPRRALSNDELQQLYAATTSYSADRALHLMMIKVHLLTGARSAEVRRLTLADLDVRSARLRMWGKGRIVLWQPVAPSLVAALAQFAADRGASAEEDAVLRPRDGDRLTKRHYDTLHNIWRRECPWAAAEMVSAHWLRHTVGTVVEREFGEAIAARFLRHLRQDTTSRYTKPDMADLAEVAAWLSGEAHPLQRQR